VVLLRQSLLTNATRLSNANTLNRSKEPPG